MKTKMKGIDIFCASQASTAICLSMDQASSSSSSSTIQLGGKAIDRHNPIIRDERRGGGRVLPTPPCSSSQPPINPKSYHQLQRTKRSSSTKVKDQSKKSSSKQNDQKKKTLSGDHIKTISSSSSKPSDDDDDVVGRKSSAKAVDLVTPPGSSRYLLSDTAFLDGLSDYDPVLALVPSGHKNQDQPTNATKDSKPSSSNQVVVLRVSLHCKGCEGKVRKHLSRMEGVSSFNIDYAAKKVTVVGDVTPLSVLASISKVKNAQFWPAPSTSSGSNIKTKAK